MGRDDDPNFIELKIEFLLYCQGVYAKPEFIMQNETDKNSRKADLVIV